MTSEHNSETEALGLPGMIQNRLVELVVRHRTLFGAFALRGVGILAGFALTFMLGRFLGASGTGTYALVTQTTSFFAAIGLLGLDISVVRHFSRTDADRKPIATLMLAKILGTGLAMLGAITLVIAFGGEFVWQGLFGNILGTEFMLVACLTMMLRGVVQLLGGILRSQHRITLGIIIGMVIIPVVPAIALVLGIASTVHQVLWATAIGAVAASLVGMAALLDHVSTSKDALKVPMHAIMTSALPLWGASLGIVFGDWYALAVVARTLSISDAGIFRVAAQITGVLMIVTTTISMVYMTQISSAFHARDRVGVARLARTAVRLSLLLAAPLALAIIGASYFLLPLIGPEFVAAMPLVVVMVTGQVLIALFGPAGLVLSMSGNERVNLVISVAGTVALLVLAPVAAIEGGTIGIASCVSAILISRNLAAFIFVRYRLGIRIWAGRIAN